MVMTLRSSGVGSGLSDAVAVGSGCTVAGMVVSVGGALAAVGSGAGAAELHPMSKLEMSIMNIE